MAFVSNTNLAQQQLQQQGQGYGGNPYGSYSNPPQLAHHQHQYSSSSQQQQLLRKPLLQQGVPPVFVHPCGGGGAPSNAQIQIPRGVGACPPPGIDPSKRGGGKLMCVKVGLLNEQIFMTHLGHLAVGQDLFDDVCRALNLVESDYFDIEFCDPIGNRYWLDKEKSIYKQVKSVNSSGAFHFVVKFYTPTPTDLEEDYTRFLFCRQLKRDLARGELVCAESTAALLASYIVQSECGDYSPVDYPDAGYLVGAHFIPNQSREFLHSVMNEHRRLVGMTPADAELAFLEVARRLDFYGIKLHPARDVEGTEVGLAVGYAGVRVYHQLNCVATFSWAKIRKLCFRKKRMQLKLHIDSVQGLKETIEFVFDGRNECKNFWKKCVEHHTFFRCTDSPGQKEASKKRKDHGLLFSRGSTFRYHGRTQRQLIDYVREHRKRREPFQRPLHASTATLGPGAAREQSLPGVGGGDYNTYHQQKQLSQTPSQQQQQPVDGVPVPPLPLGTTSLNQNKKVNGERATNGHHQYYAAADAPRRSSGGAKIPEPPPKQQPAAGDEQNQGLRFMEELQSTLAIRRLASSSAQQQQQQQQLPSSRPTAVTSSTATGTAPDIMSTSLPNVLATDNTNCNTNTLVQRQQHHHQHLQRYYLGGREGSGGRGGGGAAPGDSMVLVDDLVLDESLEELNSPQRRDVAVGGGGGLGGGGGGGLTGVDRSVSNYFLDGGGGGVSESTTARRLLQQVGQGQQQRRPGSLDSNVGGGRGGDFSGTTPGTGPCCGEAPGGGAGDFSDADGGSYRCCCHSSTASIASETVFGGGGGSTQRLLHGVGGSAAGGSYGTGLDHAATLYSTTFTTRRIGDVIIKRVNEPLPTSVASTGRLQQQQRVAQRDTGRDRGSNGALSSATRTTTTEENAGRGDAGAVPLGGVAPTPTSSSGGPPPQGSASTTAASGGAKQIFVNRTRYIDGLQRLRNEVPVPIDGPGSTGSRDPTLRRSQSPIVVVPGRTPENGAQPQQPQRRSDIIRPVMIPAAPGSGRKLTPTNTTSKTTLEGVPLQEGPPGQQQHSSFRQSALNVVAASALSSSVSATSSAAAQQQTLMRSTTDFSEPSSTATTTILSGGRGPPTSGMFPKMGTASAVTGPPPSGEERNDDPELLLRGRVIPREALVVTPEGIDVLLPHHSSATALSGGAASGAVDSATGKKASPPKVPPKPSNNGNGSTTTNGAARLQRLQQQHQVTTGSSQTSQTSADDTAATNKNGSEQQQRSPLDSILSDVAAINRTLNELEEQERGVTGHDVGSGGGGTGSSPLPPLMSSIKFPTILQQQQQQRKQEAVYEKSVLEEAPPILSGQQVQGEPQHVEGVHSATAAVAPEEVLVQALFHQQQSGGSLEGSGPRGPTPPIVAVEDANRPNVKRIHMFGEHPYTLTVRRLEEMPRGGGDTRTGTGNGAGQNRQSRPATLVELPMMSRHNKSLELVYRNRLPSQDSFSSLDHSISPSNPESGNIIDYITSRRQRLWRQRRSLSSFEAAADNGTTTTAGSAPRSDDAPTTEEATQGRTTIETGEGEPKVFVDSPSETTSSSTTATTARNLLQEQEGTAQNLHQQVGGEQQIKSEDATEKGEEEKASVAEMTGNVAGEKKRRSSSSSRSRRLTQPVKAAEFSTIGAKAPSEPPTDETLPKGDSVGSDKNGKEGEEEEDDDEDSFPTPPPLSSRC